ncbi:hypothetical protein J437_LFUL006634 [Ladona fulva]|uniref:DUF4371 domain-containing protein n=1 Tax=Ladona fulva TaxID=123851 RepID=A0A8K0P5Q9_LADFU|nr:hypothetical protein J437_LFUL006634 [Ladona fulva]
MAENVEDILCSILRTTEFALQLDESTLPGNESVLLAYVRFIKNENLSQELLGVNISYHRAVLQGQKIPLSNILAVATDGAPSMTGRHHGCIVYLRKYVPNVFCYSLCHSLTTFSGQNTE